MPGEYYELMSGTFKDGTQLTSSGTGYNPGNPFGHRTYTAFPSPPNLPDGWSEISAGNVPGARHMVVSSGPVRMSPGSENRFFFCLEREPARVKFTDQLAKFQKYHSNIDEFNNVHYFLPAIARFDTLPCLLKKPSPTEVWQPYIRIYPNPNTGDFNLEYNFSFPLATPVIIYDMLGQEMFRTSLDGQSGTIPVHMKGVPAGYYFYVLSDDKHSYSGKILIRH
jgi:hypothetical protein